MEVVLTTLQLIQSHLEKWAAEGLTIFIELINIGRFILTVSETIL